MKLRTATSARIELDQKLPATCALPTLGVNTCCRLAWNAKERILVDGTGDYLDPRRAQGKIALARAGECSLTKRFALVSRYI